MGKRMEMRPLLASFLIVVGLTLAFIAFNLPYGPDVGIKQFVQEGFESPSLAQVRAEQQRAMTRFKIGFAASVLACVIGLLLAIPRTRWTATLYLVVGLLCLVLAPCVFVFGIILSFETVGWSAPPDEVRRMDAWGVSAGVLAIVGGVLLIWGIVQRIGQRGPVPEKGQLSGSR